MVGLVADPSGVLDAAELRELPLPVPRERQIRIRVEAAALNAVDIKLAQGEFDVGRSPAVLGFDAAGSVDEIGSGVREYAPGDPVFALCARAGALASYVLVEEGPYVCRRPPGVDAESAACLPISGTAAQVMVETACLQRGESVLVLGASGGVGTFAVQLAARDGARVFATGAAADLEMLHDLGAEEAIDFEVGPIPDAVRRRLPGGVDVLIYLLGDETELDTAVAAVADDGRVVSSLPGRSSRLDRGIAVERPSVHPLRPGRLGRLGDAAAAGDLQIARGSEASFRDAPRALAEFAEGYRRGKFVLTMPAESKRPDG
jgi:NADPH:quinone reductase-like Zn-dependent oxidoreductase